MDEGPRGSLRKQTYLRSLLFPTRKVKTGDTSSFAGFPSGDSTKFYTERLRPEAQPRTHLLLVFSVTPFKMDENKNKNRSIDKVQNPREMKGGTYPKTLAKIQVRGIFRIRDIRRNVLPKFIEICMETPCWCSPG